MSKINAVRFINLNYNNNAMKINDEWGAVKIYAQIYLQAPAE